MKNQTKHTKGPWKVNPDFMHAFAVESANKTICTVDAENAILIAAAPEMLEALETIESWLDATAKNLGITVLHDQVKAAINKAKGEV